MKYFVFLFKVFAIGIAQCYGQEALQPGFVVTHQQDTLYGWIENKGDTHSSKECIFRESENSSAVKYTPEDILTYRMEGSKYYVAQSLPDNGKKVFLEYLIEGQIDLFFYRSTEGDHYLIQDNNNELVELYDKKTTVYKEGKRYELKSRKYTHQLKYALSETPELYEKIDRLSLSHKSLILLIKIYHQKNCGDSCLHYVKSLPKAKTTLGPLIGVNFYTLHIDDAQIIPFSHTDASNFRIFNDSYIQHKHVTRSLCPSLGLFINRTLPFDHQNLSFQYELMYNKQSIRSHTTYAHWVKANYENQKVPFQEVVIDSDIKVDISSLGNTFTLRYIVNSSRFSPALYFGGFFNLHMHSLYGRSLKIYNTSEELLLQTDFDNEELNEHTTFSVSSHGLTVGVGSMLKLSQRQHLHLNLRYIRGFEMLGFTKAISNTLHVNMALPLIR